MSALYATSTKAEHDFWNAAAEVRERDRENARLRRLIRDLAATLGRRMPVDDAERYGADLVQYVADRTLLARAAREAFADPESVAPALVSTQASQSKYRP